MLLYGISNFMVESVKSFKYDLQAFEYERKCISKHKTLCPLGYNRPVGKKKKINEILQTNY